MKQVLALTVVVLSLAASWYVGSLYSGARSDLQHNLCLTDQTIVNVLGQSLASITKEDVKQYGAPRIRRARKETVHAINQFASVAPCPIKIKIPRDPTR